MNIGELRKMLKAQPEMASSIAYGIKAIVANDRGLGEFASIIVLGAESSTPEILMQKSELIRFANEILAKLESK